MSPGLLRGTVRVEPHNAAWETVAAETISKLRTVLQGVLVDAQHIGSTAVRSICAKPIIDIVIGVSDFDALLSRNGVLSENGFVFRGIDHPGQYLYVCGDHEVRTHHIHAVIHGSEEWNNYVNVRDYLNSHPEDADAYSELKESLAKRYPEDRAAYTASKSEQIAKIIEKARAWRKRCEESKDLRVQPCESADTAFLWENCFEDVPKEENGGEEQLVFKVEDENGSIVGGCVLDIDETKTAEIERLWVDERYRRRGMGSALIRRAEREALQRGCRSIVNAYLFDFQNAGPLFERLGFRLIGVVKDWPKGHENYTMTKTPDGAIPIGEGSGFAIKAGSEEDGEIITDRLEAYNREFAPRSRAYEDLDKKVVDEQGGMIAGCVAGVSGWDTLHIDAFWVDKLYRDSEAGAVLLRETERVAKEKGAYLSITAGTDREKAFFTRHGYEVRIVFENQPKWYVMQKRL